METFGESLEVRVVNVEVVVTDRGGRRVEGLAPEDLRLLVDGEQVAIEYFTEVRGRVAVEGVGEGEVAQAPLPVQPAGTVVGISYLVFVDEYFGLATDRDRVLQRVQEALGALGEADEVAVVAFDGRRLDVVSPWERSPESIRGAFERTLGREADGIWRRVEERRMERERVNREHAAYDPRDVLTRGQRETLRDIAPLPSPEELEQAHRVADQVERVVTAAAAAMRALTGPEGRKVLLLLSGGWPYDPLSAAAGLPTRVVARSGVPSGGELFGGLVETANLHGYTIYPVDMSGLRGMDSDTEELRRQRSDPRDSPSGHVPILLPEHELDASLLWIARETGGKALLNDLRDEALPRVSEDVASYYWLGFTPTWKADDEAHEIEVEALRKGLSVRARRSYLDLSAGRRVEAALEGLLLLDEPGGRQELPVRVGEVKRKSRDRFEVPLTVAIPVRGVTFVQNGERWVADLELRLVTVDDRGDRAEVPAVPLHLDGATRPSPDGFIPYETTITVRKAPHDVVISVYDPPSDRLLASRFQIDPAALLEPGARSPSK